MLPLRPHTLMRPVHPSWLTAQGGPALHPAVQRAVEVRRDCGVLHRVAISEAQAAKRLKGDGSVRDAGRAFIAKFLDHYHVK